MAHRQQQEPVLAPKVDASPVLSDGDNSNKEKASDPDFEDKIELKYEDCPEKTGFAYPS